MCFQLMQRVFSATYVGLSLDNTTLGIHNVIE